MNPEILPANFFIISVIVILIVMVIVFMLTCFPPITMHKVDRP